MTIQDAFNKICAEEFGTIWFPFDIDWDSLKDINITIDGVSQTFACEYEVEFRYEFGKDDH